MRVGELYYELIVEAAAEWVADLIVVSSHRSAISSYIHGSTNSAVGRHAKCSVLVVRHEIEARCEHLHTINAEG